MFKKNETYHKALCCTSVCRKIKINVITAFLTSVTLKLVQVSAYAISDDQQGNNKKTNPRSQLIDTCQSIYRSNKATVFIFSLAVFLFGSFFSDPTHNIPIIIWPFLL